MTTPAKPWWMLFMEGHDMSSGPAVGAPVFLEAMGILPGTWDSGGAMLRWRPPQPLRTPGGWVQGGFQGVVLDMAQTIAVFTCVEQGMGPMTLEMKVSFIEAAFGEEYTVSGRTVRMGRTAAHTQGDVRDTDGRLIATATATHVIRPLRGA